MIRFIIGVILLVSALVGGAVLWSRQPIITSGQPIAFVVAPGSSLRSTAQQIAQAGVPIVPELFSLLARLSGKGSKLKAGHYELKPGTTPLQLVDQLARGEFAQESLVIIEGWTLRQMRQAVAAHPALKHDTAALTDQELLARISTQYPQPEGLFFPDTYLFGKGVSDLQVYRQAHAMLIKQLKQAWQQRDPALPYKTPYEALIMASIIEKETGQPAERALIAAVFINRLKKGMMLQTDPSVIYGMGAQFKGDIRKRDLLQDTPYNTYTRFGLPPTPIALPGKESIHAALHPAPVDALYFVSRGNGSSQFSNNLADHNRAVNQYQR